MAEKRVLIVHDDADYVEQIRQGLHRVDPAIDVATALSGPRAVGTATTGHPDVIVVDAEMVGLDGYGLTKQFNDDPATKDIPVILVTLSPTEASALRARQVGAAAHLSSTGSPQPIVDKILAFIGKKAPAGGAAVTPQPAAVTPQPATVTPQPATVTPQPAAVGTPQPPAVGTPRPAAAPQPVISAPIGVTAPMGVQPSAGAGGSAQPLSGYGAAQVGQPIDNGLASAHPSIPQDRPIPGAVAPMGGPGIGSPAASSLEVGGSRDEVPHIDDLLRLMLERDGSDLHITVGSPPGIRQRGELLPIENMRPLTPRDTMEMVFSLLSEEQRRRFETELELDFAYSIPGVSRFRANVMQQRNSVGAVFRVIPIKIPTLKDLGLPKVATYLADRPRGLVLVTGPTGSGKSTTLAAMIDHINETRAVHIVTMEDPIEFMHRNKKAYVNQREVGEDTHSFASALKRVLRQDPDVILVGEMRDLETISAAITAAETGHLVLATLHTTGGPETIDRIVDVFPPHQQQQVRMQLSSSLEGVMSQVLLRSTDGRSRVMAMEIMLGIPAIANLIREGKTHQMETIIQGGAQLGMQTLDQHLKSLLSGGKITYEEAIGKAKNPRELSVMMGRKS